VSSYEQKRPKVRANFARCASPHAPPRYAIQGQPGPLSPGLWCIAYRRGLGVSEASLVMLANSPAADGHSTSVCVPDSYRAFWSKVSKRVSGSWRVIPPVRSCVVRCFFWTRLSRFFVGKHRSRKAPCLSSKRRLAGPGSWCLVHMPSYFRFIWPTTARLVLAVYQNP
jgi:hypothetical protein